MTAPRTKTFLLARPEARGAGVDRPPPAGLGDARPPDRARRARGDRHRRRVCALQPAIRSWLWAASGLLVVHWLGDSLDGTLARVRRSERPRYGYYLDHLVDAIATALIGIGLGLSPYMLLATGLVIVIAYLVLSINTYLETQALGVFSLGYGRLGPTEARAGADRGQHACSRSASRRRLVWARHARCSTSSVLGVAGRDGRRAARARVSREPARAGAARAAAASGGAVALGPLVLGLGLGEHAEEQVGERDPHHDRLLERHHEPGDVLVVERGQSPLGPAPVVRVEQLGRERQQDRRGTRRGSSSTPCRGSAPSRPGACRERIGESRCHQ